MASPGGSRPPDGVLRPGGSPKKQKTAKISSGGHRQGGVASGKKKNLVGASARKIEKKPPSRILHPRLSRNGDDQKKREKLIQKGGEGREKFLSKKSKTIKVRG